MTVNTLLLAAVGAGGLMLAGLWIFALAKQRKLDIELRAARSALEHVTASHDGLASEHQTLQAACAEQQTQNSRLNAQLSAAQARADEREHSLKEQLEQFSANRGQFRHEFENLSREFLNARNKELQEKNSQSIDAILKPLGEKIDSFQHRVNQVHSDMVKNTSALSEQIRGLEKVGLGISSDATHLTNALKGDKKLVGNWGEAQLQRTLELAGLRVGEHFDTQPSYKDESGQRFLPDVVIRLPEGKNLVVDSKVSLVDYEAAVSADTDTQREAALNRHINAVKAHIDSLATKNYAQLPHMNSPDFVLMFMPVEPAYIEVMKDHRALFSYGYQKGVVMVSHSTLMPILRTVSNLWMVERSNAEARQIADGAGDIYNSVSLIAERLLGLGASLQSASRKYNETVTAVIGRQGLRNKVERFQQLSQKATRPFPKELATITEDLGSDPLEQTLKPLPAEPSGDSNQR